MRAFFFLLLLLTAPVANAQSWSTTGGNNQRNGFSHMPAPLTVDSLAWTLNTPNFSAWGNTILVNADRFVTARTRISPEYVSLIECRRLSDGGLLWTQAFPGSRLYAVGFDEFAVYVSDYLNQDFYSLHPADGSVRWKHPEPVDIFGGNGGVLFACNGDPVVIGKRIDRNTGSTVWKTSYTIPVSPNAGYAAFGDTYYHWEGSIITPKRVIALDMETGALKYKSPELPGDGDQEQPLTIGLDGTLYLARDGGPLYALRDNGSALEIVWTSPNAPLGRMAAGPDSTLYFYRNERIYRMNPADGALIDSSAFIVPTSYEPIITVDADGMVFVNNYGFGSTGRYYCFSPDLQTERWSLPVNTNYYAGIAPGKDGTIVVCGQGSTYKAYRYAGPHRPVADFRADTTIAHAGMPIVFSDCSSFEPDTWEWHFPGAADEVSFQPNPSAWYYTAGYYDVTLIVGNALGYDTLTKSCFIDIDGTIASTEPARPPIRIWPCPAVDQLNLDVPPGSRIRIFDAAGARLFHEEVANSGRLQINVGHWPAGMYFAEVRLRDGREWVEKMLVGR